MAEGGDVIIGIDAGTSVIKAVAFDTGGRQIAVESVANRYDAGADGSATQPMDRTWTDCAATLRGLAGKVPDLAARTVAVAVTAQGDGTWLVGAGDAPVGDAWIWLDARAAPTVRRLAGARGERARFETTGTGLNTCQQGARMAHMAATTPERLDRAEAALHCKDWLYLRLTGVRATDPSEACWTFGDFRSRAYDDGVIEALGLSARRHLLPEIVDGTEVTHPLTAAAAAETGLRQGTPVCLGYVDMVMTGMGAGVWTGDFDAACTVIGSTGVHMRSVRTGDARLNAEGTGYVMALPVPGMVTQMQTNMAATLNLDWILRLGADLLGEGGTAPTHGEMVKRIDGWLAASSPGAILYHPYISDAGERGPFVDASARAGFIGLNAAHRYPDLVRAVIEGLGMAARDCYASMGRQPNELRLTGGAARSRAMRQVLAAATGASVRVSAREEAGAAGAAMMAAVGVGLYSDMDSCIAEWVTPLLGTPEPADAALAGTYEGMYPAYRRAREALAPIWHEMAGLRPGN
jgi:erythritol kinase